ncbi:unnamed protein product [Parnassius apollo]|uniref:(apollo) hypothetical protein n=1 Tax=Parnassius apollo TaxID=110799 RepID=A0A8S3WPC1_PARAO|nr:unnamed protein product [Parnassius apollo]
MDADGSGPSLAIAADAISRKRALICHSCWVRADRNAHHFVSAPSGSSTSVYETSEQEELTLQSTSQATLQSTSQDTLQSTSQATLQSTSQATLQSTSQATLQSTSQDTWQSTSQATLQSTSQATLQSTSQATLQSTSQATLQSTSQATLQSTSQATLQSTSQATLQSTSQATLQSTSQDTWQSTSQATLQSTSQATLQSTSQATLQSTSQDNLQSTSQDTLQSTSQATLQSTSQDTLQSTSQAISEATPRLSEAIVLPDYVRAVETESRCFIEGCRRQGRNRVPVTTRRMLLDVYTSMSIKTRLCNHHINTQSWDFLAGALENYVNVFTALHIQNMLELKSHSNVGLDFINILNLETFSAPLRLGFTKEQYQRILDEVPQLLQKSSGPIGLAAYLIKLRTEVKKLGLFEYIMSIDNAMGRSPHTPRLRCV